MRSPGNPKPKSSSRTGLMGDMGLRLSVSEDVPEPEPPPRPPAPPPRLATRSPEQCRALAARQRGGEELGLSDAFVAEWAPEAAS